jgi:hypothetical protein
MDYLRVGAVVARQRAFIYNVVKQHSQSGTIHPGLQILGEGGTCSVILLLFLPSCCLLACRDTT